MKNRRAKRIEAMIKQSKKVKKEETKRSGTDNKHGDDDRACAYLRMLAPSSTFAEEFTCHEGKKKSYS